jgi:vanillate O-demethylase monooxygenase subunit
MAPDGSAERTIEGSPGLIDCLGSQGFRFCKPSVVPGTRQYRNAQFMTLETRSTTHFFWNYLHDFDLDNPNISLSLRNSLEEAFHEDLAIIEAQQKVFDADPNYQLLAIGADAALTYFRWLLARRIEAEGNTARAA